MMTEEGSCDSICGLAGKCEVLEIIWQGQLENVEQGLDRQLE